MCDVRSKILLSSIINIYFSIAYGDILVKWTELLRWMCSALLLMKVVLLPYFYSSPLCMQFAVFQNSYLSQNWMQTIIEKCIYIHPLLWYNLMQTLSSFSGSIAERLCFIIYSPLVSAVLPMNHVDNELNSKYILS